MSRRRFLKLLPAGLVALVAAATAPLVQVMARPRVSRYALKPAGWPDDFRLKICMLSDIHSCDPFMSIARIRTICDQVNAQSADIILLLGDYVTGMPEVSGHVPSRDWAAELGRLRAPLGLHAVLGNHDYWQDAAFQADPTIGTCRAQQALEAVGIPVYVNRSVRLVKDGRPFWLAGLADQAAIRADRSIRRWDNIGIDDLDATLSQVDDDAPVILMAHEPDIFQRVGRHIAVTLSGHTHGGQVNLFGWRPRAASRGSRRYPVGHFHEDGRDLIVSQGLGCSEVPIRIGCRPEILVIELG
nr:metallophosphoesterase [Rhizobium halophytocola]